MFELLNNAFQYTLAGEDIGGTLRVGGCRDVPLERLEDEGDKEVLIQNHAEQFTVEIQVSNSGV